MSKMSLDDTIAAIATPLGEGAIGIVRMSGPAALKIADEVFVSKDGRPASSYDTYTTHYGYVRDSNRSGGGYLDEVILTVMRAPKSYTREDIVEINCHGGPHALTQILELVVERGARLAEPGEFTKRAFLNGRIDLAQAEAVLDIIRAKTDSSLRAAMNQLEGEFSKEIDGIIERTARVLSHVEAAIDFPEEDIEIMGEADVAREIEGIRDDILKLLATADEGIILREGILATICGKPNVGKSSLMNLLLKRDRVIVTPIPGTTRDAVEEMINLKGFPVRIVDTAGISETDNPLDKEGAERSRRYLERSDIVLFVLDASGPIEKEDIAIRDIVKNKRVLAILNKIDLPQVTREDDVAGMVDTRHVVSISVKAKERIELLEEGILNLLLSGRVFQNEGALVSRTRHKISLEDSLKLIEEAGESLKKRLSSEFIAQDLREALYHLGSIVGRSISDDILERIFSEFCIGK